MGERCGSLDEHVINVRTHSPGVYHHGVLQAPYSPPELRELIMRTSGE